MVSSTSSNLLQFLHVLWVIFIYGGWVPFLGLVLWIFKELYVNEIQSQYKSTIEWTYLEIKPPKENVASFYNMEQVFIQLHQLFDNFTFQEKYLEGKVVFWLSLEIVSLGGKISYLIRVPTKQRDLVEAAFFANFPHIEFEEVEDYLAFFEYDVDSKEYDLFASEFVLIDDPVLPIRTYKEFVSLKAPDASEKVVDPLAPLFETFTKISPNELYAIQYLIKPIMDGSWKDKADAYIQKKLNEKDFYTLDDITKMQINGVKAKLGRSAYDTKLRILHLGKKEDFNKNAKKLILSPLKIFNSANLNGFKPAFGPKKDYKISPTLEGPYIDWWVRKRKIELFNAFKSRGAWIGEPMYVMNTEELATIFHFPITTEVNAVKTVETMEMKKIQPPADLPI